MRTDDNHNQEDIMDCNALTCYTDKTECGEMNNNGQWYFTDTNKSLCDESTNNQLIKSPFRKLCCTVLDIRNEHQTLCLNYG